MKTRPRQFFVTGDWPGVSSALLQERQPSAAKFSVARDDRVADTYCGFSVFARCLDQISVKFAVPANIRLDEASRSALSTPAANVYQSWKLAFVPESPMMRRRRSVGMAAESRRRARPVESATARQSSRRASSQLRSSELPGVYVGRQSVAWYRRRSPASCSAKLFGSVARFRRRSPAPVFASAQ